jgi:hypothetical protein
MTTLQTTPQAGCGTVRRSREALLQRHAQEEKIEGEYLASLSGPDREEALRLGGNFIQAAIRGDEPGWAYAIGFTVYWYPTRGMAKRAWGCGKRWHERNHGPEGAVGPKPEPCTLLDAYRWGRGSISF